MKKVSLKLRALALFLAAVTLFCAGAVVPASALNINEMPVEEEVEKFVWSVDFKNMRDITDNGGSDEYTLSGGGAVLTDFEGEKVFNIAQKGYLYINDTDCILDNYPTFYVEADMYFHSYPSGDGEENPQNYPMSFVTWMTQTQGSTSTSYRSIRINYQGYLCTGNSPNENPEQLTSVKLPLKEWFTIKFAISAETGYSQVYINGEKVLSYAIGSPGELASSIIRFFDNRYAYNVYMRNVTVCSDKEMVISSPREKTADFLAYQTTELDKIGGRECFDLRIISGVDSLDFTRVGYDVSVIYTKGGETSSKNVNISSDKVYESVIADGAIIDAETLGTKYLVALAINEIYTDSSRIEVVLRPYAVKDDIKIYGESVFLVWCGNNQKNHPVFDISYQKETYEVDVIEDTHIRYGSNKDNNYGNSTLVELKNNGVGNAYTRHPFFKFDFSSQLGKDRIAAAGKVYLELVASQHRTLTDAENAAGGLPVNVYGVSNGWSESTLTGNNYTSYTSSRELITVGYLVRNEYCRIDVTDYVVAHADDGYVSFMLENITHDGSGSETKLYSSEASSNRPRLVVENVKCEYEINFEKLSNSGYEPWGYAENLVDAWVTSGRDELYTHEPFETVNLSAHNMTVKNGAYSIAFNKYSNTPSSTSKSVNYIRNLSTLQNFKAGEVSVYDKYGGIVNAGIKGNATGIFHLEEIGGRSYIIDPLGYPFFMVGINTAEIGATTNQKLAALEKYGTEDEFYRAVAAEMKAVGFNTYWGGGDGFFENGLCKVISTNAISSYMSRLGLSVSTGGSAKYMYNNTMNVFDPDFATHCIAKAKTAFDKYLASENKDYIIGYYSDNEIPSQRDMLECYLTVDINEPVNAFSYAVAWTYLKAMTGKANPSLDDVTAELSEEFKAFVYNRYFDCVTKAAELAGGGDYMYLGNRIHSENMVSEGYLRAAHKYVDVISANLYGGVQPSIETIKTMYKYSGKPFVVSEFFSKANDAVDLNGYALGNQSNAGLIVDTQTDRARMYENYTLLLLESQTCLGWTWYRFRDNDQTIYKDKNGTLYRVFDYRNGAISEYLRISDGTRIAAANAPDLEVYYKGETDTSNLGSNKGIYDNKMNMYSELSGAVKNISDNLFSIVKYFDN